MDRRRFLQNTAMLAGAFCLDLPAFAKKLATLGQPRLKVGIMSDVHITTPETYDYLEKALVYFRDRGVDAVLIAGDMADWGMERQIKTLADTWYSVFPKDKAPDGHHVEKLFVYGNHDIEGKNYSDCRKYMTEEEVTREEIGPRRAEVWKKHLKEKWEPIYIKEVKGYKFIGAHWVNWEGIPGLEEFFARHHREFPTDKPFFYFQHMHPKGTCSAPWTWGQDDGKSTELFSHYPNLVAFSGHSHTSLTDDRTIWQGAFTSVGTASMKYIIPFGGRENSKVFGNSEKVPSQMPVMTDMHRGKHAQLMTVFDDCITLEKHEFVYDQPLADNWIIPLPLNGAAPLSFENRGRQAQAPQFAEGDQVCITRLDGKDRYGTAQKQLVVHFPTVLKKRTGKRAFDYEVQAEVQDVDHTKVVSTKRVFSNGFFLGEQQDEGEAVCVFGEADLPANRRVRFHVRPCECFGKKGKAIVSDWVDPIIVRK